MYQNDYETAAFLVRQIVARNLNLAESHDEWMRCAFALATLGEAGRDLFHQVARQSKKYDFRTNQHEFNSALRTRGAKANPITLGTFVKRCQEAGLELPKREAAGPRTPHSKSIHKQQTTMNQPCNFMLFLQQHFSAEQVQQVTDLYQLQTTPEGGIVFWQIDENQHRRDGKVMFYLPNGHRDHDPARHPTWMSARLPLAEREALHQQKQVLFGQHLLARFPNQPIALVEAEKTALLASLLCSDCPYLWLATGGESCLKPESFEALKGRTVMVFPDTDPEGKTFAHWQTIAAEASRRYQLLLYVSPLLEKQASAEQKARKIDIADLLIQH